MKRVIRYLEDVYLMLLSVDSHTKKQMLVEILVSILFLILGFCWGSPWWCMALIVVIYVVMEAYDALKNGVTDPTIISGTVLSIYKGITGKKITVLSDEGKEKILLFPYGGVQIKLHPGDRICLLAHLSMDGTERILKFFSIQKEKR